MPDPSRRAVLVEQATDHVLEHGLIGLSLRPLAAALGTSDRMLLHYFTSKDDLVASVLVTSNDRSIAELAALPPGDDVAASIRELWAASTGEQLERCQRVYAEAAALGLFGEEPYATQVSAANDRWMAALAARLEASGCPPERSGRVAQLVEATMVGLLLDRPLAAPEDQDAVVADLAEAAAALAQGRA